MSTKNKGSTKRKKKKLMKKIMLTGLWWIILLIVVCYLCGHLSTVIQAGTTSDQIMGNTLKHILEHPLSDMSIHGLTWYCGMLAWMTIIVWPFAFKRKMPTEDKIDITHLIETGSPEMEDVQERITTPQLPFDDKHPVGKNNLGRETNMLLSQHVKLTYNTWQTRLGTQNVLCIGGSGEGKSRYLVRPNIYSLPTDPKTGRPMSLVFTDPKGELCADLGGFLKDNGYDIRVFNLVDMEYSSCYNPFKYIRNAESLLIMVDAVVENANGGKAPSDPHWTNSAKTLLNSICFFVYYEFAFEEQNFHVVSELLNMCGSAEDDEYQSDYDYLIEKLEERDPNHPAVVWRKKLAAKGKEMSSVLSTAQTCVRLFASKEIQRLTATDTISLDTIGDKPTALFIVIPTTNDTYNFLISMLYSQLFESLFYRANTKYADQGKTLPYHVTFWLDEFANVGKIIAFDKKISTFRSANISCVIIVQSPSQIETLYDKAAPDILANVHSWIFLGSGGLGDKGAPKWVSDQLGSCDRITKSDSVRNPQQASPLDGLIDRRSVEQSYQIQQKPLLTPDEVYRLDSSKCIVRIKGEYPFLDDKIDLDTCLNFSSDRYTTKNSRGGRSLRPEFIFNIVDANASIKTIDSYRLGMSQSYLVDREQAALRRKEMIRDEEYDNQQGKIKPTPVVPEVKSVKTEEAVKMIEKTLDDKEAVKIDTVNKVEEAVKEAGYSLNDIPF